MIWGVLFLKTELIFKKYTCFENVDIYFLSSINKSDNKLFCLSLLDMYKRVNDSNLNIKMFFMPKWLYMFLTLKNRSLVYLNIFTKAIYIDDSFKLDLKTKKLLFEKIYSLKVLNNTLLLSYISIPRWKIVGYSRYIYEGPNDISLLGFCDKRDLDTNYADFESKIVVKYLIEVKGYNEKRIFDGNLSYKYYYDEARLFYCKGS